MASLVKSASRLNDKRKRASATQEDEDDNPSALAVVAEGSSKKVKRRKDKVCRLSPGCSEVRPRLGSY